MPQNFPLEVRNGSAIVKIYKSDRVKKAIQYTCFLVSYTAANGKRKVVSIADFQDAKVAAQGLARKLSEGEIQVADLTLDDRRSYGHSRAALKTTGVSLETAAREYAEAFAILGGRTTLVQAAKFYLDRHRDCAAKDVSEGVEELLERKKEGGASKAYLKALKTHLRKFARAFSMPVGNVRTSDIGDFLRELPVSNRSRKNARGMLAVFFGFCKERGWISRSEDPMENVPTFKAEVRDVAIYTPAELVTLLGHARPELIPYLVIAAFAGLRSAELQRLDWSEIALEDGYIQISATKAKTSSRRVVPISNNLRAWLTPYFQRAGPVVPFRNLPKQLGWLATDAGAKWKKNALRHSFCSYRLALVQDSAKVAYEAGNSSDIIYRHYHQLVRPADAQRWFKIETASSSKDGLGVASGEAVAGLR